MTDDCSYSIFKHRCHCYDKDTLKKHLLDFKHHLPRLETQRYISTHNNLVVNRRLRSTFKILHFHECSLQIQQLSSKHSPLSMLTILFSVLAKCSLHLLIVCQPNWWSFLSARLSYRHCLLGPVIVW